MPRITFEFNMTNPEEARLFEEAFVHLRAGFRVGVTRANLGDVGILRAELPAAVNISIQALPHTAPRPQSAVAQGEEMHRQLEELFRLAQILPPSTLAQFLPQSAFEPVRPTPVAPPARPTPVAPPVPQVVPAPRPPLPLLSSPRAPRTRISSLVAIDEGLAEHPITPILLPKGDPTERLKAKLLKIREELTTDPKKNQPEKKSRFDLMGDD